MIIREAHLEFIREFLVELQIKCEIGYNSVPMHFRLEFDAGSPIYFRFLQMLNHDVRLTIWFKTSTVSILSFCQRLVV